MRVMIFLCNITDKVSNVDWHILLETQKNRNQGDLERFFITKKKLIVGRF
jgi:hypothetical protein